MNWQPLPLSKVFRLTNGKSISADYSAYLDEEYTIPVYGGNSILGYARKYLLDGKTLVIGRVGEYCGNINIAEGKIWVSDNALYVSEWLKECDIQFIYYLLTFINFNRYSDATGQPKITQSLLKRIKPLFPEDVNEQTAIAFVLSRVDAAIVATENSIHVTEKLKKVLMQSLLTGKLKADGTWRTENEFYEDDKFGKVPKGWIVKKLNIVFDVNSHALPSKTDPNYVFRYITIESVSTESIDFNSCPIYSFKESPGRARRIIRDGDILISGVRPNLKAFTIYSNPNNEEWICSTGFYVLTPKENESNEFYFYQILSEIGEKQFHSFVAGSNYPAIGDRDIKKMRLYAPPFKEQQIIAQRLRSISDLNLEKLTKIKSLHRLKKSLMQHLLTGKVRLPKEVIERLGKEELEVAHG